MAAVVGSILAELVLDRRQWDKNITGATTSIRKFDRDSGTILSRLTKNMAGVGSIGAGAFGALAKGAALSLAPILSVGAALSTAQAALTDFDRIGKAAKTAGLDAEFFQGLEQSAMLGGVGVDQLSQALAAFNRNAGMAAIGKGELVEKLRQLHPELLKNIIAATSQEQRIRLVADALDKETDASRKAAIAAAAFGDSGTKMVEMLRGGSAALDETARKARELGIIIDRDLIARAETLNDEFSTATKVMDLSFKSALIDLAPILIGTAQLAGAVARAIGGIADSMKTLENRSSQALEERLVMLQGGGLGNGPGNRSEGADNAAAAQEIVQIQAILRQRAMNSLREQLTAPTQIVVDGANVDLTFGAGRNKAAEEAIKQAEAVKDLIATLEHERQQLGRNAAEQELYGYLKSLGIERESAFGKAVEAALTPLQRQRDELEANTKAMEQFGDLSRDVIGGFAKDLMNGVSSADALNNAVGRLRDRMLDMGLDLLQNAAMSGLKMLFGGFGGPVGLGAGGAGFLGGGNAAWGGLRLAGGGPVSGPGTSKSDSIPAWLSNGEYVVNADATRQNRALLDMINSGVDVFRGFAAGGYASRTASAAVQLPDTGSGLNVKIINESGQEMKATSATRRNEGGMDVVEIVMKAWGEGVAQGRGDSLLGSLYGLKRRGA